MCHLATAHAQTLHSGWAYNRVKIPLCKNFKAKEGMGVYSRWAYFRKGTVQGCLRSIKEKSAWDRGHTDSFTVSLVRLCLET